MARAPGSRTCVPGATVARAREAAAASLDPVAVIGRICAHHASGVWLTTACALEGATRSWLDDRMAREPALAQQVATAHALGVEHYRGMVIAGVDRAWWLLERFSRMDFAPPKEAPIPLQPAGPMVVIQIARGDITRALDGEVVEVTELVLPSSTTEESD